MRAIFFILVFSISAFGFSQSKSLFEKGKDFYKQENHTQAIASWEAVLKRGKHSAALYFNLGNAHYKLNHVAESIYFYEKALQLSPEDSDIKNNLIFAQIMTIDAIEQLPQSVFSKWYKSVTGLFSYNGWAVISVVFSGLFVILFLVYYYGRRRLYFALSVCSALLLLGALSTAFLTLGDVKNDRPAIIFTESIGVKSGPTMADEVSFTLHEGTKVNIIEKEDHWAHILLTDGKDGWIPLIDLKEL